MPRKAPELDREAALVRAAKSRALIIGHLGKSLQLPHTLQQLLNNIPDLVKQHHHDAASIDRLVRQMVKNNQLIRNDEHRPHTFYLPSGLESSEPVEPKVKKSKAVKLDSETPVLSATFIKATGRVRFQLQGMIIEIGVE